MSSNLERFFREMREAARDPQRHEEIDGQLRVVSRMLLPVWERRDKPEIETYAEVLRYVFGCVAHYREDLSEGIDRNYLVGRLDALLMLCMVAGEKQEGEPS